MIFTLILSRPLVEGSIIKNTIFIKPHHFVSFKCGWLQDHEAYLQTMVPGKALSREDRIDGNAPNLLSPHLSKGITWCLMLLESMTRLSRLIKMLIYTSQKWPKEALPRSIFKLEGWCPPLIITSFRQASILPLDRRRWTLDLDEQGSSRREWVESARRSRTLWPMHFNPDIHFRLIHTGSCSPHRDGWDRAWSPRSLIPFPLKLSLSLMDHSEISSIGTHDMNFSSMRGKITMLVLRDIEISLRCPLDCK